MRRLFPTLLALPALLILPAAAAGPTPASSYRDLLPEKIAGGRPVNRIEDIEPLLARLRDELDLPAPGGSLVVYPVPDLQGGYTALSVLQLDPAPWNRLLMTYFHELGHRGFHRERAVEEARAELLRFRVLFHLLDREPELTPLFLADLRSYQRFTDPLPFPDRRKSPAGTTPVDQAYRDAAVVALALWHRARREQAPDPLRAARAFIDERLSGEVRLAVEQERARPGGQASILRTWAREEILPRLERSLARLPEGPGRQMVSAARLFYLDPLDREGAARALGGFQKIAAGDAEVEVALEAAGFALSILVDDLEANEKAARWLEKLAGESRGMLRATLYRKLGELRESSLGDRTGAAVAYRAASRASTSGSVFADEVLGRLAAVEDTSERRLFSALAEGSAGLSSLGAGPDAGPVLVRYVGVLRIAGRHARAAQLVAEYARYLRGWKTRALALKERAAALAELRRFADSSDAWRTLGGRVEDPGWRALAAFREGHDGYEALRREQVKAKRREGDAEHAAEALGLAEELLPPDVPADRAAFDRLLLRLGLGRTEGIESSIADFFRRFPASDLLPALELLALPPLEGDAMARREGESELQARLWAWLERRPRDRRGPTAFRRLAESYDGPVESGLLAGLCRLRYPADSLCAELARQALAAFPGEEGGQEPAPEALRSLADQEMASSSTALEAAAEAACRVPAAVALRAGELLLSEGALGQVEAISGCALAVLGETDEEDPVRDRLLALRARARSEASP